MAIRFIYIQFFVLFLVDSGWSQSQTTYHPSRMERRADSVSMITDNLITSQKLLHLTFESRYEGDTTIYYRHYYIDTINQYLVKCILDTTFDDYYKKKFTQAVIYFNQGYEFKSCYNKKRGTNSDFCTLFNIYPEENEIAPQTGKLNINWTKKTISRKR
jgi:hypothetical protein